MAKKRCQKPKNNNGRKPSSDTASSSKSAATTEQLARLRIISDAKQLRDSSYYGPELEQRTLICRDSPPFTLMEKSSGVSWIGVTGKDSACVVSMRVERPQPSGRRQLLVSDVLATVFADMSDGACAGTVFRKYIPSRSPSKEVAPSDVVSIAPGFVEEENGDEGRPLAVRFLEKRLELNPSFTSNGTTEIAICALKYLLGPKFKSVRIEVRGFGNWEGRRGVISALLRGSGNREEGIVMVSAREVDRHLAGNTMDLTASFDSFGLSSP